MKKVLLMVAVLMFVAAPVFAQMGEFEIEGNSFSSSGVMLGAAGNSSVEALAANSSYGISGLANTVTTNPNGTLTASGTLGLEMGGGGSYESFSLVDPDTTITQMGDGDDADDYLQTTDTFTITRTEESGGGGMEVSVPTIGVTTSGSVSQGIVTTTGAGHGMVMAGGIGEGELEIETGISMP